MRLTTNQPLVTPLGPKATKRIAAAGGRPTNSDLSYFNVEWAGEGMIVVVGAFRRANGPPIFTAMGAADFSFGPGRS